MRIKTFAHGTYPQVPSLDGFRECHCSRVFNRGLISNIALYCYLSDTVMYSWFLLLLRLVC